MLVIYQGFHEGLPYSNTGRMIELNRISTFSDVTLVKHRLIRPIRWFDFVLLIVCDHMHGKGLFDIMTPRSF